VSCTAGKTVEKAGELCGEGTPLSKPYDHQLVYDHIRRLLAAPEQAPLHTVTVR
jgi:hypothetical protein